MGFSSFFFGKKPGKQAASEAEKSLARSGAKDFARLSTRYFPLQEQLVQQSGRNDTNLLAGRSSADIASQASQAEQAALASGTARGVAPGISTLARLTRIGGATSQASINSQLAAAVQAQDQIDTRKNALVGGGFTQDAYTNNARAVAADNALREEQARLDAARTIRDAKTSAIGSVIGTGASLYAAGAFDAPPKADTAFNYTFKPLPPDTAFNYTFRPLATLG